MLLQTLSVPAALYAAGSCLTVAAVSSGLDWVTVNTILTATAAILSFIAARWARRTPTKRNRKNRPKTKEQIP